MRIEFLKMQGLGNDFFVFDAASLGASSIAAGKLRELADRHTGVGFDQALMLEAPRNAGSRVYYRIFNSDGGEVEQCGNGARCIAALMYARAPQLGREIDMDSPAGPVRARVRPDGLVSVDMGVPEFEPRRIPLDASAEADSYALKVGDDTVDIGAVSTGNPHAVLRVPDTADAPIARLGPGIERHPRFPQGANVGFMQIVDRTHIRLRVFERGVGETLACGTGACAAVVVGRKRGLLEPEVRVDLPGGSAHVAWAGPASPMWLTGPAVTVFSGMIDIQ